MSDSYDYFRSHAVEAVRKARALPPSRAKLKQRVVARVYHLLGGGSGRAAQFYHLDDFRAVRRLVRAL